MFPTQGVRPAISTVNSLLGSNLPHFMYIALMNDTYKIHLDFQGNQLIATIGKKKYSKEIVLDLDIIRASKSVDEKNLVIVHELGHALTYSILFGTPPKQININSSGFANGFVINHHSVDNKTFIRNQITIYLAGIVAEEIVFGEAYKSNGASFDIMNATDRAAKYVRKFGMGENISCIENIYNQSNMQYNYDINKTNDVIESILQEEKTKARDLIQKNIGTYKALVKQTITNNSITIEEFVEICNKDGLNLVIKELNDKLIYSYDDKVQAFLKK